MSSTGARSIRLAPVALAIAVLTGCNDDPPTWRPAPTTHDGLVVIDMTDDMTFAPAVVIATVGDTIMWINRGDMPHTTTARREYLPLEQLPPAAESWDSGLMESGHEYRIVVNAPGEYLYVCTLHQAAGMVAGFRVE